MKEQNATQATENVNKPFIGQIYFIQREVPREAFEFIALSGGADVVSSNEAAPTANTTHVIADRGAQKFDGKDVVLP